MESLYFLWKTTGELRWREYAWRIFDSIEKQTRTESGYASVKIEGNGDIVKVDEMQRYVITVPSDKFLADKVAPQLLPRRNVGWIFFLSRKNE